MCSCPGGDADGLQLCGSVVRFERHGPLLDGSVEFSSMSQPPVGGAQVCAPGEIVSANELGQFDPIGIAVDGHCAVAVLALTAVYARGCVELADIAPGDHRLGLQRFA